MKKHTPYVPSIAPGTRVQVVPEKLGKGCLIDVEVNNLPLYVAAGWPSNHAASNEEEFILRDAKGNRVGIANASAVVVV